MYPSAVVAVHCHGINTAFLFSLLTMAGPERIHCSLSKAFIQFSKPVVQSDSNPVGGCKLLQLRSIMLNLVVWNICNFNGMFSLATRACNQTVLKWGEKLIRKTAKCSDYAPFKRGSDVNTVSNGSVTTKRLPLVHVQGRGGAPLVSQRLSAGRHTLPVSQ